MLCSDLIISVLYPINYIVFPGLKLIRCFLFHSLLFLSFLISFSISLKRLFSNMCISISYRKPSSSSQIVPLLCITITTITTTTEIILIISLLLLLLQSLYQWLTDCHGKFSIEILIYQYHKTIRRSYE